MGGPASSSIGPLPPAVPYTFSVVNLSQVTRRDCAKSLVRNKCNHQHFNPVMGTPASWRLILIAEHMSTQMIFFTILESWEASSDTGMQTEYLDILQKFESPP